MRRLYPLYRSIANSCAIPVDEHSNMFENRRIVNSFDA